MLKDDHFIALTAGPGAMFLMTYFEEHSALLALIVTGFTIPLSLIGFIIYEYFEASTYGPANIKEFFKDCIWPRNFIVKFHGWADWIGAYYLGLLTSGFLTLLIYGFFSLAGYIFNL